MEYNLDEIYPVIIRNDENIKSTLKADKFGFYQSYCIKENNSLVLLDNDIFEKYYIEKMILNNFFAKAVELLKDNLKHKFDSVVSNKEYYCSICNDGSMIFLLQNDDDESIAFCLINGEILMINEINIERTNDLLDILFQLIDTSI